MTDGPLSHLRVLDLSRAQPGAYCTAVLADLGADVLRVEARGTGDTTRIIPGAMEAYHRGKRAMTLDLKHDDAPAVLRSLIDQVDVVVESGLPAALAGQGVDYSSLAAERPGLVWCTLSGFGEGSPYAKRPAHDVTFLGYSGLMALMAGDTVPPTPDFVLAVPFGSLIAVIGILAALTERDRTGRGAFVDTAIVDSATWVLGEAVARVAAGQPAGWGEAASRRAYRAADGKLVTLAAAEPRTWAAFCAAVDRPDLVDALMNPPGGQVGLAEELAALFATKSATEWESQLAETGAAVGPVRSIEDLLDDPHLAARGALVELDDDRHTRVLRTPVRLRDATGAERPVHLGPPPALSEHTDAALADAGFTADEIAGLHDRGAV
jgi:crotonobetainyl-CoA:carnitine CoA-transferase CaiB-like acyl-CoA transferase